MIINTGGDSYRKGNLANIWGGGYLYAPSAFDAQTIEVDLSGYDMLYIVSLVSTVDTRTVTNVIPNDPSMSHSICFNSGAYTYARTVTLTDSSISFSTGQLVLNGVISDAGPIYAIPICIYGY